MDIYNLTQKTILGINPPIYDFAWFDLWAKPAGLLNLLGHLRAQGNQVELLDCLDRARTQPRSYGRWKVKRVLAEKPVTYQDISRHYYRYGLSPEEISAELSSRPAPDLVLVTSIMTYWYPGVFEIIKILRQTWPQTPLVLGGIYATLCPEHAAQSGADVILPGGGPLATVPTPLDLYAQPTYALIATTRGCPRRCDYCASARLSPGFKAKPVNEIVADLEFQLSTGAINDLAFYDDALLWEAGKRFFPLLDYIAENHPSLRLHTPNGLSVAHLDKRCCTALHRAGFKTLRLSLEGTDAYTNQAGSGKTTTQDYLKAVTNLLRAGYAPEDIETYILAGLPGQKLADVKRSMNFVRSAGARPKLCEFSPIPGSKIFAEALARHPEIGREPLWHNNTVYSDHLAKNLWPEELQYLKSLCRPIGAPPNQV